LYVIVWEPKGGAGGGHQVALTIERAEAVHRALRRAMPEAHCEILAAHAYTDSAAPHRQEPRPGRDQRQRRRRRA